MENRAAELRNHPSSTSFNVGVVIVNYNRRQITLRAVDSVMRNGGELMRVIVVENSEDNDERLQKNPRYEVLDCHENTGFAGGCNAGIARLSEQGVTHFLLLNNDAVLLPGCIDHLTAAFDREPHAGIIAPAVIRGDGSIESVGIRINRITGRHRLIGYGDHVSLAGTFRQVEAATGTAMLISKTCFEKTGGFDARLFCYFEDVDFCYRAKNAGFSIHVEPAARVQHLKDGISPEEIYYSCRNHLILLQRHMPQTIGGRIQAGFVSGLYRLYLARSGMRHSVDHKKALRQAIHDANPGVRRLGRRTTLKQED